MKELTDKQIWDAIRCDYLHCEQCSMDKINHGNCRKVLASALQAERAKVKNDVWTNAPVNSAFAVVSFSKSRTSEVLAWTEYTRELPKTLEQEIAETAISKHLHLEGIYHIPKDNLEKMIIDSCKEYAERIKQ